MIPNAPIGNAWRRLPFVYPSFPIEWGRLAREARLVDYQFTRTSPSFGRGLDGAADEFMLLVIRRGVTGYADTRDEFMRVRPGKGNWDLIPTEVVQLWQRLMTSCEYVLESTTNVVTHNRPVYLADGQLWLGARWQDPKTWRSARILGLQGDSGIVTEERFSDGTFVFGAMNAPEFGVLFDWLVSEGIIDPLIPRHEAWQNT